MVYYPQVKSIHQIKDQQVYKGFSLIELLAVLTIIGILSTIAYPNYRDYIVRVHRSDGQTALLDLANRMERYHHHHHTYQTATIGTGKQNDILPTQISNGGWYILSIEEANKSAYLLQATPTGTQASSDTLCQSLTLNHLGNTSISSGPKIKPTGSPSQCW